MRHKQSFNLAIPSIAETSLRQHQKAQPNESPIAATRRCEVGRQAAERAVCPLEELDETARVRPVRQIRGLVRAWRTKVREPSGAREAGVLDAAVASSRLKTTKLKRPPPKGVA